MKTNLRNRALALAPTAVFAEEGDICWASVLLDIPAQEEGEP